MSPVDCFAFAGADVEPRYFILIRHNPAAPDFGRHSIMSLGERLDRLSSLARIATIICKIIRVLAPKVSIPP
jgi:hypothetical protein